jgi:hypothetical protein
VSLSAIPRAIRDQVFKRDLGACQYCRLVQIGQSSVFHINHIIPKSKGGLTVESNLALQCPYCSLSKSNRLVFTDPHSNELVTLFHPLQQRWSEHFAIEENGVCRGLSAVGRATVEALRMNDPLPRVARALQIRLGLLSASSH